MIPDSTVQAIKDAADIADVVGRFVTLKKSGVTLKGLCPFHDEKTPSFTVRLSANTFKCFGCGVGGDSTAFIMAYKNLTYPEALEYLAGLYSIPIDATGSSPKKRTLPTPRQAPPPPAPITFYPKASFRGTLKYYDKNNFAQFLINKFGAEIAAELIGRYFVGTSAKWPGANVFWQVDAAGKVRGGKVMLYNSATGKRNRERIPTWAHSLQKLPDFILNQCFFGEHLLSKRPTAPVGIVESEKTAILASAYLPQNIWLASCGKDGLSDAKFEALRGRKITLWPDAGLPDKTSGKTCFVIWSERAAELRKAGFHLSVSTLIEDKALEAQRSDGYDLADYLLRYDLASFARTDNAPPAPTPPPPATDGLPLTAMGYPAMWDEPAPPTASRLEIAQPIVMANEGLAMGFEGVLPDDLEAWTIIHNRTLARPGLAEEIERQRQTQINSQTQTTTQ